MIYFNQTINLNLKYVLLRLEFSEAVAVLQGINSESEFFKFSIFLKSFQIFYFYFFPIFSFFFKFFKFFNFFKFCKFF